MSFSEILAFIYTKSRIFGVFLPLWLLFWPFSTIFGTFWEVLPDFLFLADYQKKLWFGFNALNHVPILTGIYRISFFDNWNGFSGFQIFAHISLVRSRLLSYQPNLKCFSMKEPKTKMERKPRINSMLVKKYEVPFLGKRLTNDFFGALLKDMSAWSCKKVKAHWAKKYVDSLYSFSC